MDERMRPGDHFKMKSIFPPSRFKVDFNREGRRDKVSYDGPIAVLVGPGAFSAGDFGTLWAASHPRARTFGKSTAMGVGLPTQASLGTELNLHPEWSARIAETNTYRVGAPHAYLIHTDFVVDERVWLKPDDVAAGRDTVVEAALQWFDEGRRTP
jgi:C-terminal processing protease CtpA/Prc